MLDPWSDERRVDGPAASRQLAWQQTAASLRGPLAAPARRQGFVVTHEQARRAGVTRAEVRRNVRRGVWTAPRRGVLCMLPVADDPDRPHGGGPEIAASAVALVRPDVVVSHESASVVIGLPTLVTPARPVATMRYGNGGGRPDALVHAARLSAADVTSWYGVAITSVARTVVDIARNSGADAGIIAADAALREELTSRDELRSCVARATHWPGVTTARRVAELADPRAESPLESIGRLLIGGSVLPLPDLQRWIPTRRGTFRVDGLWDDRAVVVEFDGLSKSVTADALALEKLRQEAIEQAGYRVVRLTWNDIRHTPGESVDRLARALREGGRRAVR